MVSWYFLLFPTAFLLLGVARISQSFPLYDGRSHKLLVDPGFLVHSTMGPHMCGLRAPSSGQATSCEVKAPHFLAFMVKDTVILGSVVMSE